MSNWTLTETGFFDSEHGDLITFDKEGIEIINQMERAMGKYAEAYKKEKARAEFYQTMAEGFEDSFAKIRPTLDSFISDPDLKVKIMKEIFKEEEE